MILGKSFKKKYTNVEGDFPFPEIELEISNCFFKNNITKDSFIIDTGAGPTCINYDIFDNLDIEYHSTKIVEYGDGGIEERDTCLIDLEFPQINFIEKKLEVVVLPRQTVNLLGRDVLNKMYLLLNGPMGTFKIKY